MSKSSRYVLVSALLLSSLAEARGVWAKAVWFAPGAGKPPPWQKLTSALPSEGDCTERVSALPKQLLQQLGLSADPESPPWYQRICAEGPHHLLVGHFRMNRKVRMSLVEKSTHRVLRTFTLPKGTRAVWAQLDSTSELLVAYNQPKPESFAPAENPVHVWFVDPRTGAARETLTPASDASVSREPRTGAVQLQLGSAEPIQLGSSGQFCSRITNTVSRSEKRVLVFETCIMFE